jgi:hypothetical protein
MSLRRDVTFRPFARHRSRVLSLLRRRSALGARANVAARLRAALGDRDRPFAYVLYLIGKSGRARGPRRTAVCWLVVAVGAHGGLPLAAYVLVHVGMIWLVRSLYYYSGVHPRSRTSGLSVLGVACSPVWAAQRTGSAWLAFWCFFLSAVVPRADRSRSR